MNNNSYPSKGSTNPKERYLGNWVDTQRQRYKSGELSALQIKRFESEMPGWSWIPQSDRVNEKKQQLLKMARSGKPRPLQKTKLGMALSRYKNESSDVYDPKFNKEIREIAPDWFINSADENKKELLEMARAHESRPSQKTKLGQALGSYLNKASKSYDPEFDKKIRQLAPHWFINSADENKKKLLKMARAGASRPSQKTKLGISRYTMKKSTVYDGNFDKKIRETAPHWFVNSADENKKKLLEMARSGKPRPTCSSTLLGRPLAKYTNNKTSSYDPKFNKKIRRLAPHWFINSADEKKKLLLKMARRKKPRPNRKSLGGMLSCYIDKNNSAYDAKFNKEIRQLAPHWFRAKISPQRHSVAAEIL